MRRGGPRPAWGWDPHASEEARSAGAAKPQNDAGQAAVELALVLPFVALLLLAVVQLALIARDQVLTVHAAREGARQAAVDRRPGVAQSAAARGSGLKISDLRTETSYEGGSNGIVTVRVQYSARTDVPLVGPLLPDLPLRAKAAMRAES